jgi:hypothetical protein
MGRFRAQIALLFFVTCLPGPARAGDSVNNGGGLSEAALVFSAKQLPSFLASCRRYDACGAQEPYFSQLAPLASCRLRGEGEIRFSIPKDAPELKDGSDRGLPFRVSAEGTLLVNRLHLYSPLNEPLRLPEAIGYITRIQLDLCGGLSFTDSAAIGTHLAAFADFEGERITIGKDDLHLPSKQWIRVRSFYSDLILESSEQLLRLACEGNDLRNCSLTRSDLPPSSAQFKNLGLVSEKVVKGRLSFVVEGLFEGSVFSLEAEFEKGIAKLVRLNGIELELPND